MLIKEINIYSNRIEPSGQLKCTCNHCYIGKKNLPPVLSLKSWKLTFRPDILVQPHWLAQCAGPQWF